jgi:hypothetical protein
MIRVYDAAGNVIQTHEGEAISKSDKRLCSHLSRMSTGFARLQAGRNVIRINVDDLFVTQPLRFVT